MKKITSLLFIALLLLVPNSVQAVGELAGPVGLMQIWSSNTVPEGYLIADGRAVSRNDYKELFAVIGTTYGSGDGSTTFNLPKLSGNVPVGIKESDSDFGTLGKTGGEKTHTLTVAEMAKHTHIQKSHTHTQNSHTHDMESHNHTQNSHNHKQNAHTHSSDYRYIVFKGTLSTERVGSISGSTHVMAQLGSSSNDTWGYYSTTPGKVAENIATTAKNNPTTAKNKVTIAKNQDTTAVNKATGGGKAHTNLQPYIVMNYIIKAK